MLTSIFKILLLLLLLLLLFFGSCSKSENSTSFTHSQFIYKNFAILGPISSSDVNITLLEGNKTLFTTQTNSLHIATTRLKWGEYGVGSFDIKLDTSLDSEKWIHVSLINGLDVDKNDDGIVDETPTQNSGTLRLYAKVKDINKSNIIVNAFTTIATYMYDLNRSKDIELVLSEFAKSVFIESVDESVGIDYRDLYAYVPNHTSHRVLKNPYIYENLLNYGFMNAVLEDKNITQLLQEDSDGDGLTFLREILEGSNPDLKDSDGDGIDDYKELRIGTNPSSRDSDFDTLSDYDEINLYKTNPLSSDSDDDYLPDALEIAKGSDALKMDEDVNGIADGLDDDPFLKYQWYIKSLGDEIVNRAGVSTIVGNDLDILGLYHYVVGSDGEEQIKIQVVDSGVELSHEDLDVDTALSYNSINHSNDPTATKEVSSAVYSPADIGHGSAVAGIIAAKANNGLGVRGVAPYAKIAGSNWLEDETIEELEKVWYSQIDSSDILVSNNSWGTYVLQDLSYEEILSLASSELRDGKGRVFTFASGNFRKDFGNANLSYLTNNPYVVTVASLNHKDSFSSYSNPGSNVLVSAYGGEYYYEGPTIMTTLLMGKSYYASEIVGQKGAITVDEDSARNYTYVMNGTSAATPMVSGIIALTMQACPELSYRDVKWLLANTSKRVDKQNPTWIQNGAGLWHSIDYGYGKVDGVKMLESCRSKYFKPLGDLQQHSQSLEGLHVNIPDNNSSVVNSINFTKDMKVEWVGLTLEIDHPFAGDLEIALISPSGTETTIMTLTETHYNAYKDGFRFGSVAFVDESSLGLWRIKVVDRLEDDYGTLHSIKLEVYGH